MAKVTVTVCDQCGTQDGVRHFEVREGARKAALDLCGTHGKVLDQLLGEHAPASQRPAKRASRPRAAKKVMTMEEIEALKKKK
jgi:hypothetical protein